MMGKRRYFILAKGYMLWKMLESALKTVQHNDLVNSILIRYDANSLI